MSAVRHLAAAVLVLAATGCGGGSVATPPTSTTTARIVRPTGPSVLKADLAPWGLPAPRSREVAVNDNGQLVVAGGLDALSRTVATVWRIAPSPGRATTLAPLVARVHDAAGARLGGRVLVFGGGSGSVTAVVQQVAPPAVVGHLPEALADVAVAQTASTAYVVGGYDGVHARAEVHATTDGTRYQTVATLPVAVRTTWEAASPSRSSPGQRSR